MTDGGIELDSNRQSHHAAGDNGYGSQHDADRADVERTFSSSEYRPAMNNSRFQILRRYTTLLLRHSKSHHEAVYLLLLPTLYFRFFPFLLTHNSTPLSAYLAVVFVYIPAKVVRSAWGAYTSSSQTQAGRKRKSSVMLPFSQSTVHADTAFRSSGKSRAENASNRTAKLFVWLCGAILSIWVYTQGISSPFPTSSSIVSSSATLQAHQARNASYFIAASFWNNENILDSWTSQTLQLIDSLGRPNVYVSLTENDSDDNTASKLLHFGRELTKRAVAHSVNITMDLRGYPPENPWHSISHRMGYMSNLRNGALSPLETLKRRFENIILLNDVVYHHTDVLKLIAAVGGDDIRDDSAAGVDSQLVNKPKKRRMACSLDMDGATLYDTWVLRDRCGRAVSGFWPFFTSEDDQRAVRKGQVLDVGTCWNGIVVLDGDMLLDKSLRDPTTDWTGDALRFQQPPECLISECALLPLTIANVTGGSPVVMDTSVIVGYSVKWWNYYAVWLRMPVVRLWMKAFEEGYWGLWWTLGMGKGLRWMGLENGKEKRECIIEGWPTCGSQEHIKPGTIKLKLGTDEL